MDVRPQDRLPASPVQNDKTTRARALSNWIPDPFPRKENKDRTKLTLGESHKWSPSIDSRTLPLEIISTLGNQFISNAKQKVLKFSTQITDFATLDR